MVVVDEDEYIDLSARIELSTLPDLTEAEQTECLDWLESTLPGQFTRNDNSNIVPTLGPPESRPLAFTDTEFMSKVLASAAASEVRMKEAEKQNKVKRKERLKLFHACLREYLDSNKQV